jgi:hypothetical protein
VFLEKLKVAGILSEIKTPIHRVHSERIEVTGKPVSQTILEERERNLSAFIEANAGTDWDYDPEVSKASLESLEAAFRNEVSTECSRKFSHFEIHLCI